MGRSTDRAQRRVPQAPGARPGASGEDAGRPERAGAGQAPDEPPVRQRMVRPAPLDLQRLVDIAVEVFLRRGYDGTSMSDIAAAAGVRKASLYHHVAGKEELLLLGSQRSLSAYRAMLEEPEATAPGDPAVRLRHVVRRTCELVAEYLPETALLIRIRGNTETERLVLEQRRAVNEVLAGMIAEVRGTGPVDHPDPRSRVIARLVVGMITSSVDWFGRSMTTLDELVESVYSIIDGTLSAS